MARIDRVELVLDVHVHAALLLERPQELREFCEAFFEIQKKFDKQFDVADIETQRINSPISPVPSSSTSAMKRNSSSSVSDSPIDSSSSFISAELC